MISMQKVSTAVRLAFPVLKTGKNLLIKVQLEFGINVSETLIQHNGVPSSILFSR